MVYGLGDAAVGGDAARGVIERTANRDAMIAALYRAALIRAA